LHFHVASRDIQLVLERFPMFFSIVGRSGVSRGRLSVGLGVGELKGVKLLWFLLQAMFFSLSVIRIVFHLRFKILAVSCSHECTFLSNKAGQHQFSLVGQN